MEIIPVLDIAGGLVMRAIAGERSSYRPLGSPLAASNRPTDVLAGLLSLYPFRKFYVADLDGIEGRGRNTHLIPELSSVTERVEFWVDAGTGTPRAARSVLAAPVTTLVVGSESLESLVPYQEIMKESPERTVLSLDFRGDEFMGPAALLENPDLWPSRVIVMTLKRIGTDAGPDLKRIAEIKAKAGAMRKVYAAGGVRDRQDLDDLVASGAAGVLVSSVLHTQKITAGDLAEVTGR